MWRTVKQLCKYPAWFNMSITYLSSEKNHRAATQLREHQPRTLSEAEKKKIFSLGSDLHKVAEFYAQPEFFGEWFAKTRSRAYPARVLQVTVFNRIPESGVRRRDQPTSNGAGS